MSNQSCVILPIENQNLRLWYDLKSVMKSLVKIHRFPISSELDNYGVRFSCRALEARSHLKEQQSCKVFLMLLLSLAPFFFANVPACRAAMEGDVSIDHYHCLQAVLYFEQGGLYCLDLGGSGKLAHTSTTQSCLQGCRCWKGNKVLLPEILQLFWLSKQVDAKCQMGTNELWDIKDDHCCHYNQTSLERVGRLLPASSSARLTQCLPRGAACQGSPPSQ